MPTPSAPLELSFRFTSRETEEDSPISVSLFRPDSGNWSEPVPFEPPLDDEALAELRWYLERYWSWPTEPDHERAKRIEARLDVWGRALMKSITPDRDSVQVWREFASDPAASKLLTIDAIDPRVLRLPWELLADEDGHIFTQRIGVRRRLLKLKSTPPKPFELPVRVLVIVARPDDEGFLNPRADAQPLLDALEKLDGRAEVEFLYPPTLQALTERLRDASAPPVHVVHFDGHGVYKNELGLGYLLFEDERHKKDLVDANRLGTLLSNSGVPLMVLSACQSGAQEEENNPYASVAARLIRAGVGSVLAMNYSVLVEATRKFVDRFYGSLAAGMSIGRAIDEARYRLLADTKRHTVMRRNAEGEMVEQVIRLQDWFLPALYQQASDPVVFGPLPPPSAAPTPDIRRGGKPRALVDSSAPGGLPREPLHGFHGRARELLRVERALAEQRVVVLWGFGGLGKTTLAAEAGRWFYRTGRFPGGAAFVSFEHGGALAQLCSWVGQAVSGDENFAAQGGDAVARVAELLREKPALVILDNFESVLGREPLMPAEELREVLDAVWTWANVGGSRVLITSRDITFNDSRFAPSKGCRHLELHGLTAQDALELAGSILDNQGIERERIQREALLELMERLGGHPLSLYLVLPHLRTLRPSELTKRFEELLPGFTTGAAKERNESLAVSLEFSLRRLGDATRAALPDLAVFQGAAFEDNLLEITEIDPDLWQSTRAEMEQAALVSVEAVPGVNPPFLRFHPTLLPYLSSQLPAERRIELETRYWQHYYGLANFLYHSDTQHPHQARAIALREMPNLQRALDLTIAAGEATAAVNFTESIARFLNNFGHWREQAMLLQKVAALQVTSEAGLIKAEYLMRSQQGETMLQQGQAAEAERLFKELLAKMGVSAAYNTTYDHAMTLSRLGECVAEQGRHSQAIAYQSQAIQELENLRESSEVAKMLVGECEGRWANSLVALGQYSEAQQKYEAALSLFREVQNERNIAVTLSHLGMLALECGNLREAEQRYKEVLNTFRTLGEPREEATFWHQLGRVAEAAKNTDEAERCYREAVRIREQIQDLPRLATTYNQLAILAKDGGRLEDAERWFLRAQEIKDKVAPDNSATLNNIAALYLSQGRLTEAERYALRAAAIKEGLDASSAPWMTYTILAAISVSQDRVEEATQWQRKAQDSYAAYPGSQHAMRNWYSIIAAVVDSCQMGTPPDDRLISFLDRMEQTEDLRNVIGAIRRIIAGERDLEILRTELNHTEFLIIHMILAQLSDEAAPTPTPAAAPSPAQSGAEQRVAQVRQQWAPVIEDIVAACAGNTEAAANLGPFLDKISQQDDWRALAGALRRVLAGERDAQALLPGLDQTDAMILGDVLRALGAPGLVPAQEEEQGISLEQLIDLVGAACRADAPPQLAAQLHAITQGLAQNGSAPEGIRALGRALNAVLSGERAPELAALPPALAARVQAMVAALG